MIAVSKAGNFSGKTLRVDETEAVNDSACHSLHAACWAAGVLEGW